MQSICGPLSALLWPLCPSNVVLCPLSLHLHCLPPPPRHPPPPRPPHSHHLLAPHPSHVLCHCRGPEVHRCALPRCRARSGLRQDHATERLGQGQSGGGGGDCFCRRPCILRTPASTAIIGNHFTTNVPMDRCAKKSQKKGRNGLNYMQIWHSTNYVLAHCFMQSLRLSPTWLDPADSSFRASRVSTYSNPGAASKNRNVTVLIACAAKRLAVFRSNTVQKTHNPHRNRNLHFRAGNPFTACYFVAHFAAHSRTSCSHFLRTNKHSTPNRCCTKGSLHDATHIGVHRSYPKYLLILAAKHSANATHITHESRAHRHRICMPCIYKGGTEHRRGLLLLAVKTVGLIDTSHTMNWGGGVLCTHGPWIMQCTIMHN